MKLPPVNLPSFEDFIASHEGWDNTNITEDMKEIMEKGKLKKSVQPKSKAKKEVETKNMGLVMKASSRITKEGKKRVLNTEMKTKAGLSQKEKDGIKTTLNQVLKEHLG